MRLWRIAFRNLLGRRSMTLLALTGLVLGVATIVALVSISTGVQSLVMEQTSQTKGIMVMQKDQQMGPIFSVIRMEDVQKIGGIPGVRNVCPRIIHLAKSIDGEFIVAGTTSISGMVMGVDPSREARKRIGPLLSPGEITRGRYLLPTDTRSAVLGKEFADEYKKVVGSTIELDGVKFKVVGIFETGIRQTDSQVYMPLKEAQALSGLGHDFVRGAFVELEDVNEMSRMAMRIEAKIPGIRAVSTEQFGEMISGLISNVEYFLWAISAIAALVAGINIVNTMLMSIMDREKELGVMRAIGWTGDDVIALVMAESVLIGVAGGVIGLFAGWLMVQAVQLILDIPMLVDLSLAIRACAFSISVGALGGVYPAWRASKMDPLMAIRGE